jgi:hypothetical protein
MIGLRDRDKMKDDAVAQLSDQLIALKMRVYSKSLLPMSTPQLPICPFNGIYKAIGR